MATEDTLYGLAELISWQHRRIEKMESQRTFTDPERTAYEAEEYECAMMFLDKNEVPRETDDGLTLSLVGRICAFRERK